MEAKGEGCAVGEGSWSRRPRQLGSNCRACASLVVGVRENACAGDVVVLMVAVVVRER